jgi:CBS domain-containing protein
MKIKEIMSNDTRCIRPDDSLVAAAELMRELDVGALPVCDNERLAGMVTDRDIAIRGVGLAREPLSTPVRMVMSQGIVYAYEDDDVESAGRLMEEKQIRRLPVLNMEKRLVGIVSLGDLALSAGTRVSGAALREISQPK